MKEWEVSETNLEVPSSHVHSVHGILSEHCSLRYLVLEEREALVNLG